MGSALAMWAMHRRLSMEAAQGMSGEDTDPHVTTEKTERRTKKNRTESECSSIPPEDHRVPIDPHELEGEGSDEENREKKDHHKHRRFSLDFLFGKNRKNKKQKKEKRSQSIAVNGEADNQFREMKYPGLAANEFAMFYFI